MTLVQENALGWLAGLLREAREFEQWAQAGATDLPVAEAYSHLAAIDGACLEALQQASGGLQPVAEGRSLAERCMDVDPAVPEAAATTLATHREAILRTAERAFDNASPAVRTAIKAHFPQLQHALVIAQRLARRHTEQAVGLHAARAAAGGRAHAGQGRARA